MPALVIEPSRGAVTTRVFPGYETQVARELRWTLEAPPVDDLRREHHRRVKRNAAEALKPLDHRRNVREQRKSFDLAVKLVTPLQLVQQ